MFKNCRRWMLRACFFFLFTRTTCRKPEWRVISEGLDSPESVVHDQDRDVYLVSNTGGVSCKGGSDGYILVVDPSDDFKMKRLVSGGVDGVTLNAPKGMALSNDVLWVADINTMRRFHPATGKPLGPPIPITGSTDLNDVCAAPDGTVVVSDTGFNPGFFGSTANAIYRVFPDGTVVPVAASSDLRLPNGVFCESDGNVLVVNLLPWPWAKVSRVSGDGETTPVISLPKGALDGIEKDDDGSLYVSSWWLGGVYRIEQGKEAEVVIKGITSPADFTLDKKRGFMILPSFLKNEVHIIPLQDLRQRSEH